MKILALILSLFLIVRPCLAGCEFDHVDDWVDCGSDANIDSFTSASFSAWVYVENLPTSDDATIVSKLLWDPNYDGWVFSVKCDATPECKLYYWGIPEPAGDNNGWSTDVDTIVVDTWYHIGFTYTRTSVANDPKFYIDGVSVTVTEDKHSGKAGSADADADFNIGKRGKAGSLDDDYFDGQITEVAYWNIIISDDEMALLGKSRMKQIPLQIQPANLKLYLPMDDEPDGTSADGDTFMDLSGNGNNGTGDDGANNTGLTAKAEEVLSYP